MENDPLLTYWQSRRSQPLNVQREDDDDPLLGYLQTRKQQPQQPDARRRVGGKAEAGLVALTSGIPGMEAMGGAISKMTGGTYQGGRRDIGRVQREAKEQLGTLGYEGTRLAPEIAASFTPMGGATRLGRMAFGGGVEAIRGASRAGMDREEAPTASEVARSTAMQGALGAGGAFVGEAIAGKLGKVATRLGKGDIGQSVVRARRGATEFLRSPQVQGAASAIPGGRSAADVLANIVEPIDATRVTQTVRRRLPASDETVGTVREQAQRADETFKEGLRQAREEAANLERMAAEQTQTVMAGERQSIAGALRTARQTGREAIEQSRTEAQRLVDEAQRAVQESTAQLGQALPTTRTVDPNALRNTIRAEQLQRGQESYGLAMQLGATPDPQTAIRPILENIRGNRLMQRLYRDAQEETGARGGGVVATIGAGDKARQVRVVDLEGFDKMRQQVRDRVMSIADSDVVGSRRTMMRDLYNRIDAMEEGYLKSLPREAGDQLRAARSEYAAYFRDLEALRDGLNLGFFGVGKRQGLIKEAPMSLDLLERTVKEYTPRQRAAFEVGAAQWVNDVLARGTDDAVRVARMFVGTPERIRRTRLAIGDDATELLQTRLLGAQEVAGKMPRVPTQRAGTELREAGAELQARTQALGLEQRQEAAGLARDIIGRAEAGRPAVQQLKSEAGQLALAREAFYNPEDAITFLQTAWPSMSPSMRQRAQGVVSNSLVARLNNMNPTQAQTTISGLRQNPAANALLGTALEQAERDLMRLVPGRNRFGVVLGSSAFAGMRPNER
jgi:hypothetical protein